MMEAQYWHTWKETVTHLQTQLSLEQFQQLPSSPINIFIPLINIHQRKKKPHVRKKRKEKRDSYRRGRRRQKAH
jgi:hypothetical protein